MRFIKFILIPLILLAAIGFGVYYYATNIASEKIVESVSADLDSSGQVEDLKEFIESDPELQAFVEEAKTADQSELPFTTTGEATRVLIKKVGITELSQIQTDVQSGKVSIQEVIASLQEKLTEDELLALKVIAYKEIYK